MTFLEETLELEIIIDFEFYINYLANGIHRLFVVW